MADFKAQWGFSPWPSGFDVMGDVKTPGKKKNLKG